MKRLLLFSLLGMQSICCFAAGYDKTLGNVTATSVTASSGTLSNGTVSATPSQTTDIANKFYVDTVATGLSVRDSVMAATTGTITLSGNVLVDSYTTVAGDRILVKNNANTTNGLYIAAAGAWSRSTDYNQSSQALAGTFVAVTSGTVNNNTQWVMITTGVVLGVSTMTWSKLSQGQNYTAGTGLSLSLNQFSITGTVGAGSCTNCNATFNAQGQATAFSNGSGGGPTIPSTFTWSLPFGFTSGSSTFTAVLGTNRIIIATYPITGGTIPSLYSQKTNQMGINFTSADSIQFIEVQSATPYTPMTITATEIDLSTGTVIQPSGNLTFQDSVGGKSAQMYYLPSLPGINVSTNVQINGNLTVTGSCVGCGGGGVVYGSSSTILNSGQTLGNGFTTITGSTLTLTIATANDRAMACFTMNVTDSFSGGYGDFTLFLDGVNQGTGTSKGLVQYGPGLGTADGGSASTCYLTQPLTAASHTIYLQGAERQANTATMLCGTDGCPESIVELP